MKLVSLALTNICNLDCWYCVSKEFTDRQINHEEAKKLFLPMQTILDYFDMYFPSKDWMVCITAAGEPTLYPYFQKLLDKLTERNYHGIIYTNGLIPFVKSPNFKTITTWHTEDFPKVYDRIIILKDIRSNYQEKIQYCIDNKIDHRLNKLVDATKRKTSRLNPVIEKPFKLITEWCAIYCEGTQVQCYHKQPVHMDVSTRNKKFLPEYTLENLIKLTEVYAPYIPNPKDPLWTYDAWLESSWLMGNQRRIQYMDSPNIAKPCKRQCTAVYGFEAEYSDEEIRIFLEGGYHGTIRDQSC